MIDERYLSRAILILHAYRTEISNQGVPEFRDEEDSKVKVPDSERKQYADLRDVGDDVLPVFCLPVPSLQTADNYSLFCTLSMSQVVLVTGCTTGGIGYAL
jgi:hypothetical protein